MDQIVLFGISEKEAYELIRNKLEQLVLDNGLELSHLSFKARKQYHSVMFDSSVVVRISNQTEPHISIPSGNTVEEQGAGRDFVDISMGDLSELPHYTETILQSLQSIIDRLPSEFSCCSRYEECSNARICTNPNKALAVRCSYRKKLKNGTVFFGKNRNVE